MNIRKLVLYAVCFMVVCMVGGKLWLGTEAEMDGECFEGWRFDSENRFVSMSSAATEVRASRC